jgi:hypothetical protein
MCEEVLIERVNRREKAATGGGAQARIPASVAAMLAHV